MSFRALSGEAVRRGNAIKPGNRVDLGAPWRSDKRKALSRSGELSVSWKGVVNHRWQRAVNHQRR
jgi:hypothetical protein